MGIADEAKAAQITKDENGKVMVSCDGGTTWEDPKYADQESAGTTNNIINCLDNSIVTNFDIGEGIGQSFDSDFTPTGITTDIFSFGGTTTNFSTFSSVLFFDFQSPQNNQVFTSSTSIPESSSPISLLFLTGFILTGKIIYNKL
ncbi:MAG: hypothetical protein AB4063_10370 [Crocosphaera sp.]